MMLLCIFLVFLSEVFPVPAADRTSGITQDRGIITAEVGATVTLKCFFHDYSITSLSWFKLRLKDKPLIISTWMKEDKDASINPTYDERFRVESGESINHLTISRLRPSDTATYICGILEFSTIEFGQGAFLHIKESLPSIRAVIHQPMLEPLHLGDSVNLTCSVFAEKCAGELSLCWFRHGADQPAIMSGAGQFMKDLESQTTNYTLNLTIKSASPSDTGVYYCVLATCGEIFFGNGTRVEIAGGSTKVHPFLVCCLSVALAVSVILLLGLAVVVYKLKKQTCSVCKGRFFSHPTCSAAPDTVSQDEGVLHYAALGLNRTDERRRQDVSQEGFCVYSTVKSR